MGGLKMNQRTIEAKQIADFGRMLREEERSGGTIENYLRHVRMFSAWLENRCVSKELVAAWKERLLEKGYSPGTVNSMVVSLNRFLAFRGWADCRVKTLRIQRQLFREDRKELTRTEYDRLIAAAQKKGKVRLALLMETVCATGIRVSEVRYITVEALRRGWAEISLKGKIRTILIPDKLRRKLMKFAHKRKKRFRRDISHQKQQKPIEKTDLGRDESHLHAGGGDGLKGFSAQPAPSFC